MSSYGEVRVIPVRNANIDGPARVGVATHTLGVYDTDKDAQSYRLVQFVEDERFVFQWRRLSTDPWEDYRGTDSWFIEDMAECDACSAEEEDLHNRRGVAFADVHVYEGRYGEGATAMVTFYALPPGAPVPADAGDEI